MKRSEFLSIIPALGTLPFLSKEVIREKDRIIIPNPKQIEIVNEMPAHLEMGNNVQFLLCIDGQVVGTAAIRELGMSDGRVEEMSVGIFSDIQLPSRLEVKAVFNHEKVVEAFFRMKR